MNAEEAEDYLGTIDEDVSYFEALGRYKNGRCHCGSGHRFA
jgi:hypothetical protein